MPGETGYITLSEVDSNSTSEWCESGSDTTWENQQEPAPGLNSLSSNLKAPPFVPSPSSVPSAALPSSFVPSPRHKGSMQGSMNDQDKYPDLPDYMPYMPRCVPHASPSTPARHALSDRSIGFTVDQMNAFHQQQNGSHRYLYPGGHYPFQRFSGAGAFQQAEHEFTTDRSQGTGMGLQKDIKNEYQPDNSDLLMTYSGMGLWFDPSIGASAFRPQQFPHSLEDNGFNFDIELAMPFAPSQSALAMELSSFALSGVREPTFDTKHSSSKSKASFNVNSNTIPLLCFLCERTPKFSDVSHLLTHISSKGHLSRSFNLQLTAQTDINVQQRLDQFDNWFKQNGIQQLLTARQEAKHQKKQTQVKNQRGIGKEKKSRRPSGARESLKREPENALHIPVSHLNPLNQQNWHQGMPFGNSYQTPSHKRSQNVNPEPDSTLDLPHQDDEAIENGRQGGSGTPALKGVIHEGMGIFDAGTPEMKRMRNQRKHPSVLNNMLLVSESISMTEQVWNGSMTKVEHERNVYDTPTDLSSPGSKEEDEPLSKKARGSNIVSNPNGPTSKRLTRSSTRAMNSTSSRASRGGKRGGGKRGGGGGKRGGGRKIPKMEDEDFDSDEELEIRRGKRGLNVFRDPVADDAPLGGDIFGGHPQGMHSFGGSSFSGHQMLSHRAAMQALPSNRPMSSMYGRPLNHQFTMYDKENDRNAFSLQQTSNMHGYFQPRQNMEPGAFNPLCVQRQDNFPNVYDQVFDSFKPSNVTFQPMSSMGYSGLHGGINTGLSNGSNNGSQFPPGINGGPNNGFDIQ